MARWLAETDILHGISRYGVLHIRYVVGIGALLLSLCGAALILSMCSLCNTRKQVRDKASSSSDGDSPPAKQGGVSLFKKTPACSNNISKAGNQTDQIPSAEQQQQQQQGRSPHVWQRAILMGERCQRPTFSGLVLYDEKGNPLPKSLPVAQQAKTLR